MNKRAAVINWEFWKNKKEITLWEAILLSLDFNPRSKSYQGKGLNKELRKKEIAERLNLLKDTLKRKRDYILGESGADFQNSDCVDIRQFSAWCICAELSTPDPLRDIAVPIKTDEEIPLTNNLDSLHKLTEAYFGRSGSASPDVIEEIDLRARERRRVGLYTLEEAAFYVGENSVVIPKTILIKFIEASRNGDLIVYMPGGVEKYKPDVARPWYEESFWNDLNNWLEKNEPRIGRIFPKVNPKRKEGGKKVSDVRTQIRYDETRLFLRGRIDAGMTNIENIWDFILTDKFEKQLYFVEADHSTAKMKSGRIVLKKDLNRQLKKLLKKINEMANS